MTLILIESMKLWFTEETKPDYYEPKESDKESGLKRKQEQQKWGVIHRAQLPSDTNGWQEVRTIRPEDKPAARWGAQNTPIQW